MFFKEYKIKDDTIPSKKRHVLVAAMLGEKPSDDAIIQEKEGHREVFYIAYDVSKIQGVKSFIPRWKELAETHLAETLDTYQFVPLPDDLHLLERKISKSLQQGYMKNKVKKQFLQYQLEKLEEEGEKKLAELGNMEPQGVFKNGSVYTK